MKKKKRIISLFLVVITVFLMFTQHSPFSFAQNGSGTTGGTITDDIITPKAEDVNVIFKDTKNEEIKSENGIETIKKRITVNAVEYTTPGGNKEYAGSIYPSFKIQIDLGRFSYPGVPNDKGRNKGKDYGYTNGQKTPDTLKLKENHQLRIPVPKDLQLRDVFFKNKKYIQDGKHLATITKKMANEITSTDVGFDNQYNYIIFTFTKNAEDWNYFDIDLEFEATFDTGGEEDIELPFDVFDHKRKLIMNVDRKIIEINHILKKTASSVDDKGDYGAFNYFLLINRKQQSDVGEIVIKDTLRNHTGNENLKFDDIGFDKTSFVIEKGNFNPKKEHDLIYGGNDSAVKMPFKEADNFELENGNIKLEFGEGEKPKNFILTIKDPGGKGYKLTYTAIVPETEIGRGYTIANDYSLDINGVPNDNDVVKNEKGEKKVIKELKYNFNLTISAAIAGRISVLKTDEENQPLAGAKFKLVRKDGKPIKGTETFLENVTGDDGKIIFDQLPVGETESENIVYDLYEIEAPKAYIQPDETKPIGKDISLNIKTLDGFVKATNTRKKIDITVNKIWAGTGATEHDVIFTLKRHIEGGTPAEIDQKGVTISQKLAADNNSANNSVQFNGLYEYDSNGNPYIYTVEEMPVAGYHSDAPKTVPNTNTIDITNTIIPSSPSTPPAPPSDDDSTPPPSDDGGTGTTGKVEKITPKPPKPEEPKKEEPKKEEPPKPETPVDATGEPTVPPSTTPNNGVTENGSTSGGNETNVLPGVIPGTSSSGTNANVTNKAVTPAHTGKLPKTGEGLNSSAYAMLFAVLGMGFVVYGMMRRTKKQ